MSSFASFEQFIRHGGQASIVLSFRAAEPVLELKRARLDRSIVDAFEHRLRDLAAENWSEISASFARVGIEIDPAARDVSAEIERSTQEFSEQAAAMLDTDDEAVADADIASLADWLARRFATEINERRQRQLGVTHYIWRSRDDDQVRPAHAERDDRVFAWDDEFPDGPPGHGYNCRCVAEPAIVGGTVLLAGRSVPSDLHDRIVRAEADGFADAGADAAVGTVMSVYSVLRFSYLGYRRLFGVITPEEEAERLRTRESLAQAIDVIANLDAETARQVAEAFVDYFDARHADLRLLDLEYRLGLAPEETLLKAYHDVAYLDAATMLGGLAVTTTLTRLGVGIARFSPRPALVALRSAALRFDGMIAMRSATVDSFVARRFAELAMQGHGPQRHEGAVTRQMLIDRVLHGIDPMTGTARDGVTGRPHRAPPIASRITSPEAFVAAESFVRRTREYRAARDAALFEPAYQRGSFLVVLPLEDVLGPDYLRLVEGVRIAGGGAINADFDRGSLLAVFRHVPGSEPALVTMYPITR